MPGARFFGRDGRVGHQLHVGTHDSGAVGGQHHRAVHLRQLAQAGGSERDVQMEATGTDPFDLGIVPDDDQSACAATQDAF